MGLLQYSIACNLIELINEALSYCRLYSAIIIATIDSDCECVWLLEGDVCDESIILVSGDIQYIEHFTKLTDFII